LLEQLAKDQMDLDDEVANQRKPLNAQVEYSRTAVPNSKSSK